MRLVTGGKTAQSVMKQDAPSTWNEIMGALVGPSPPKKFICKIALAAAVYMIWKERNRRIFTSERRTDIVCAKDTIEIIMLRNAWKRMRKHKISRHVGYDQLLNDSYKYCRPKVAQIFDRVANIGRDPRLRLLLGNCHE
ncbi:hypothetical protein OSB04_029330 [Centaurea solstitialis]|uniref:Uncharacterized protein n=1 Tax=Centaurea solstitialis TaxID=347529 RepID=A0AA38WA61_9ASTR|nr:hypothetical protein OSB04_029330 [Centaurea solstitialis]